MLRTHVRAVRLSYERGCGKDCTGDSWVCAIQQDQHIGGFPCGKIGTVIGRDHDPNTHLSAVYQVVDFYLAVNGIVIGKIAGSLERIQQRAAGTAVVLVENNGRNILDIRVIDKSQ